MKRKSTRLDCLLSPRAHSWPLLGRAAGVAQWDRFPAPWGCTRSNLGERRGAAASVPGVPGKGDSGHHGLCPLPLVVGRSVPSSSVCFAASSPLFFLFVLLLSWEELSFPNRILSSSFLKERSSLTFFRKRPNVYVMVVTAAGSEG